MPALVAGIHVLQRSQTWMAGASPAMTMWIGRSTYSRTVSNRSAQL